MVMDKENEHFFKIEQCRICKSKDLVKYLNFGKLPLANSSLASLDDEEFFFPLEVMFCRNCFLSQLSIVVDPKLMFSYYTYRSSISKTFQRHCAELVDDVSSYFGDGGKFAIDIASNDGCLLKQFKAKDFKVLGVEPADNIADIAIEEGIPTMKEFWSKDVAEGVVETHGKADIVVGTNVFAHVNDLDEFIEAVNNVLKDDGVFVIEVPYMANLISKTEFDTIYHEHLSFFLLKPLEVLFKRHAMRIANVKEFPIHGGTIRVSVIKDVNKKIPINEKTINTFLDLEESNRLHDLNTYLEFVNKLHIVKKDLLALLNKLKKENKKVAAYAASAKGNTLFNYCGINKDLVEFIIDETPEKENKFFAGNHIPIYGPEELEKRKPDYLVILAWNFAKEIINKTEAHRKREGKYIIPIPNVMVIGDFDQL